jgi:hypothetical protein
MFIDYRELYTNQIFVFIAPIDCARGDSCLRIDNLKQPFVTPERVKGFI